MTLERNSFLAENNLVNYLNCIALIHEGEKMHIKAKFKNGQFVPLEKVKLSEGEVVELDLIPKKDFSWKGALSNIKSTSVELQHNIKEKW